MVRDLEVIFAHKVFLCVWSPAGGGLWWVVSCGEAIEACDLMTFWVFLKQKTKLESVNLTYGS